uniref:Chromosome 10 open reading frame 71 n=1 Tax=Pelusios castaneus TaxID=367368 RepID=A0A8C8SYV3_9SAUR
MQGNKKHTDGLSDSSSIGSHLDDTDREVCSLTARAFKSLSVAELDASDNELDLVISPEITHQFSGKFRQGMLNHTIKKSSICNKLSLKNNEHTTKASTFQQFPKRVREEKKVAKSSTMEKKKPNLPAPGPRNNKHVSKVSCLIKTFDKTENQCPEGSLAEVKKPVKNCLQKCKLIQGNDMAFWDDPAILNIQKELSEFSDVHRDNHWLSDRHELQKRHNKMDAGFRGPDGYYPALMEASNMFRSNLTRFSKKTVKTRRGKVKEPTNKGNFLHSENSAFESWNAHHNKLSEKEEFDHVPPVTGSQVPVPLVPVHPVPPTAAFPVPIPSATVPQVSDTLSSVSKALAPAPSMSPVICTQKKATKPEQEYICPPWRRQRNRKGVAGKAQESSNEKSQLNGEELSSYKKPSAVDLFAHTMAEDKQIHSPESISPTFNITKLLTPIIPSKQEVGNQRELVTPPIPDTVTAKGHAGSEFSDYSSRDNYKSKAPSLLFNLKDVRKRVKSTYSPSPLLKTLEEKNKTKENMKRESAETNVTVSTFPEKNSLEVAEKDELSHRPFVQADSTPENDNKTDLEGHLTASYLSLSSPQTTVDTLFYKNQGNWQQDDSKNKDLLKDTENSENLSLSGHQSNKHGLRKSQHNPSRKGYSRENGDIKAAQQKQRCNCSIEGHGSERDVESQNGNDFPKIPPKHPSPAEDEDPYNENRISVRSITENKGKSSNSSSEYSFVSMVDQPLQEDRSEMNVDEKQSSKEEAKMVGKDELQYYSFSNCNTSTEERSEGKFAQGASESMTKEKLMSKKREEIHAMNSATEDSKGSSISKSEEPASPLSSNSFKPSLFQIKDNTFKSFPVTKAVKRPLLRSLSLDDAISTEKDKQVYRQLQGTPSIREIDWSFSRSIKEQNVREDDLIRNEDANELGSSPVSMGFQRAEDTKLTWDPTFSEDAGSFSLRMLKDDEEVTPTQLNKDGGNNEESVHRDKEKPKIGKVKHYLAHQKSALENNAAQNQLDSPSEEKTNYFKNNLLSNRRGGSCAKKIITREISSPATSSILENHVSDSLMCSAVTDPWSEKIATSSVMKAEDVTNSTLLNVGTKNKADMSAEEILDSTRRSLFSEDTSHSRLTNDRLQLLDRGAKPLGKPPAVPPKSEKALRRAKKLANKRKKIEALQKNLPTEHMESVERKPSLSGRSSLSPLTLTHSLPSPVPNSRFPPESRTVRLQRTPSVSPMPSLPTTQRKLLQDPDSGQYFFVDLPIQVQLKTFYEPETGKYIQISIPSSQRDLHQTASLENRNSPCVLYPSVLPLPVPIMRPASHLSEPLSLMQKGSGAPAEATEDWQLDRRCAESPETEPYIEPVSDSPNQHVDETQQDFRKDLNPPTDMDIISISDLEDFAVEGIS